METATGTSAGSVESVFHFLHYKVDFLRLRMIENVELIKVYGKIDTSAWDFKIGVRQPQNFVKDKLYLGGVEATLYWFKKDEKEKVEKNAYISIETGIVGLFKFADNAQVNPAIEDNLVKHQIPFILLPYLRSTVSSLLATGGYGGVIFPLININELAKDALKDKPIIRVE